MLTNALTAALALVLAPLVLPKLNNQKAQKDNGFRFGVRYFCFINQLSQDMITDVEKFDKDFYFF